MPVTVLDDQQVGNGKPGAVTMRLRQRYWEADLDAIRDIQNKQRSGER